MQMDRLMNLLGIGMWYYYETTISYSVQLRVMQRTVRIAIAILSVRLSVNLSVRHVLSVAVRGCLPPGANVCVAAPTN